MFWEERRLLFTTLYVIPVVIDCYSVAYKTSTCQPKQPSVEGDSMKRIVLKLGALEVRTAPCDKNSSIANKLQFLEVSNTELNFY